jgi:uncharacterized protein YnzC (UPF0291/DUF896 family)
MEAGKTMAKATSSTETPTFSAAFLNREAIFAVSDIKTEDVFVPEWGGAVKVKGLTARERDEYETSIVQSRGKNVEINRRNIRAKLVVMTVVDDAGNRLFGDTDLKALGEKSAAAIDRLFGVAQRLSGLTAEDEEDLAKNSESDRSDDSGSD